MRFPQTTIKQTKTLDQAVLIFELCDETLFQDLPYLSLKPCRGLNKAPGGLFSGIGLHGCYW